MKKQLSFILLATVLVSSISYLFYTLVAGPGIMSNLGNIIKSTILFVFSCFFFIIGSKTSIKKATYYIPISSLLLISFISFNLLSETGIINLPEEKTVNSFTSVNISEALEWANSNDIKVEQVYEYSDVFEPFQIISQNIKEGTALNDVKEIEFVVSNGPNYDKNVIVPNMSGWKAEDVVKFIEENYLIKVTAEYQISDIDKDTVISQSKSGEIKRNDSITITFSLGSGDELAPVKLVNFAEYSLFSASLWLKSNGIKYELSYQFSDTIERDGIVGQNIKAGTEFDPNGTEKLVLNISKGKQIVVPDLAAMDMESITKWISDNGLKIKFNDRYDEKIAFGKIIEINYKKGDTIEEGTLINVVTSKGQLTMPDLDTLYQYREWASQYNLEIEEQYEFSDSVAKGGIVKLSHQPNAVIANDDKIVITISQGKAMAIPSFTGKTKTQAVSLCKTAGLRCSYTYGSYSSSIAKDTVTAQSKRSGAEVISGTSIVLTLSKGKSQVFEFGYQESWINSGNANTTISFLRTEFAKANRYPGVNFTFRKKATNNQYMSGLIHPDSPTYAGMRIEQGRTYEVWVIE